MTTRNDIERVLWSACDSFRNKIDSSRYKDYILAMLFIKYLSDVYRETREKYIEEYNGNMARHRERCPANFFALYGLSALFTFFSAVGRDHIRSP